MAYLTSFPNKPKTSYLSSFSNTTETKKPFASTRLGIAVNTLRGIPKAAKDLITNKGEFAKPHTIATDTVLALPKSTKDEVVRLFQATARSFASAGLTFMGKENLPEPTDPTAKKLFHAIYGANEPIQNLQTRVIESSDRIKASPFAKQYGFDKHATLIAFGGVLGQTGLDLSFFGGSEGRLIKQLAKESNPVKIIELLVKTGIERETAAKVAKGLAETTNKEEVRQGLDILKKVKSSKNLFSTNEISKDLKPLAEEAKKYKSAEEFVKAMKENPDKIPTTPEYQKFLQEKDNFIKRENEIYAEMKTMRDKYANKTINDVPPEEITKYDNLQKELNQTLSKKTLAKVPEGVIKTHIGEKGLQSQLTDFYNQAVGETPPVEINSVSKNTTPATYSELPNVYRTGETQVQSQRSLQLDQMHGVDKRTTLPAPQGDISQSISEKNTVSSYVNSVTSQPNSSSEAKDLYDEFSKMANDLNVIPQDEKAIKGITGDVENLKDISGFMGQARDVYRNFKAVFGKQFGVVKKALLDPFDRAKGDFVDMQKSLVNDMKKNIVDKYGFKKGSKESAAIMNFGEGLVRREELDRVFGVKKAGEIAASSEWFRNKYDILLEQVNKVMKEIYPNRPEKIIPKRKDYFRHFREMSIGLGGLRNAFETPSAISPELSGVSPYTQPKAKFLPFAQRRTGTASTRDAIGGYLNYVPTASYAINIDPFIGKFRALAKELSQKTEGTRNLNNFIEFIRDFANDLSGKTNPADRYIQKVVPGGRTTMRVMNWLNNRVKANTILGNVSSSIAQIFNVPQGIASAKLYSIPGAVKTMAQAFVKNPEMAKSIFIKERYHRSMYDTFDIGLINNTRKFAAWMVGALDQVGTRFIWNSHYSKAIAKGVEDPIKYADDITRKLVAGRGVGEVPLIQKAKFTQFVAPFQLEVANSWHVMKDMVSEKDFAGITIFFVTGYLMNQVAAKIRGSDVVFDPINATIEGARAFKNEKDKKKGVLKFLGREAGEVLSNFPGGQSLAQIVPEKGYGGVSKKEFFGEGDPTRYGGGLIATKALQDPLYKILPPFGGNQIKKAIEGLKAVHKGKVTNSKGKTTYRIKKSGSNFLKALLFGKYALPESQKYYNKQAEPKKTYLNSFN